MLIRLCDIILSLAAIVLLSPFLLVITIIGAIESKGDPFFMQRRVGKNGKQFNLLKYRTMRKNSDKLGLLTVGDRDPRVTPIGRFLRKYKLDEIPQLFNVLKGDMSIVGPRPEVKKYVDLYTEGQRKVLQVRPGITDYASLSYIDENEILAASDDPEKTYIEEVMPAKIELNFKYIENRSLKEYFKLIFLTIGSIFRNRA